MDMKKYIAICAAAIALLAGCKDYSYETWKPDETFSRTGEVSFLATFENLETKAFMDEKGHGTWDGGDQIAVACTDGTLVNFSLDGTGDTKRAIFKGTIPAGKELGGVAVYPASAAVSSDGGSVSLKVPGSYKASVSSTYPGVMVAAIGNDWNLSFKQALGFLKLTINNYPAGASKILLSSPDGALSGTFKCAVSDILERGLRPSDATEKGNAELLVGAAGKSVYAFLPVPAADYSVINASFRDAKGQEVISQALSDYSTGVSRAELHDMIVVCEDVMAPPCRINLGGEYYNVGQVSPGVFEGEFEVPASTSFTVELDGEPFGFATCSGAGGLGTITSDASALPVAKIKAAGKSKRSYYVKRALGTLASTAVANNPFTVNLESPGKMHVRIDNSNPAAPRYSIQLVEAPDPAVIFHEDFDLCTLGGDYIAPADGNGQKADTYDGYLPASGTVTQNNGGFTFDYPEDISTAPEALPAYMQAYGLQDWHFAYAAERPGGLQLCSGSIAGFMTTPAFSSIQGSTDAVIEVEIARFSTSSTDPVYLILENGGTFKSGTITRDAYTAASQAGAAFPEASTALGSFQEGGTTLELADDDYFPHSWNNADIDKPVSHIRLEASGLTSATKFKIDCPKGAKNAPRIFVFDIKVTKK